MEGSRYFLLLMALVANVKQLQGSPDCDFEPGLCGWQQDQTDQFDWSLTSGESSSVGTGALGDHSTSDGSGNYLYIETSPPRTFYDRARLLSPDIPAGTYCVQFYYYMYGRTVYKLKLYLRTGPKLPAAPEWIKMGTMGAAWVLAAVDVTVPQVFNVVLEGVEGVVAFNISSVIAIDDIHITNGTCSSVSTSSSGLGKTCTFETDMCGYTQDTTDNFDWTRHRGGTTTSNTGPASDHTLQTNAGYYIYVDSSAPRRPEDKARIETLKVPAYNVSPVCVSFWYSMYGSTIGILNIYIKRKGVLGPVVWTRDHNQGSEWKQASLSVSGNGSEFSVVFEAVIGDGHYSDIALDDVVISSTDCSHPGNCNFDTGLCTWNNDPILDNFDWLITSKTAESLLAGPVLDHTMNNATGKYAFMGSSGQHMSGDKAWFVSQDLSPNTPSCLGFWYNMDGDPTASLNIWVNQSSDGSQREIWSLSGNQGESWRSGQVAVPPQNGSFQILFEGVQGASSDGYIAIDDISFDNNITCTDLNQLSCNFDLNFCGWLQATTDTFDWQRQATRVVTTSTGPTKDHSGNGYFAFMDSSSPHQHNDNAVLVSPVQTGPKCLTFWYFMWGDQVSLLNVYAGMNTLYWFRQGTQGKQWNQANIHFEISLSFQIYIEGLVGTGPKGDIAIDDITVTNGSCPQSNIGVPGVSCDFENDFCEYVQGKTDTFDWTRQVGSTSSTGTGPPNDHSYGTQYGHYVYIEATNETQGAAAVLTVSNVSIGSSDMCLEFWYHMYGVGQGVLMVTTSVQGVTQGQWSKTGNQGPFWNRGSFDISASQGLIDIIFEADRGSGDDSDTALDDIVLKTGKCMEEYGLCNFDLDLCSWTNLESGDDIDWVQNSGVTRSSYTGPSNDHTFGNMTGKYLYIESSSPSVKGYRAVLASELFGSSDMVCFRFWYNMYGKTIGTLRISLSSYNTSVDALPELSHQVLWELSGNQGQGWFEGVVPITIQEYSYKIFIEGVIGDSYTGDIAIDDLSLNSWEQVSPTDNTCPYTPRTAIPSFTTPTVAPTAVSGPAPDQSNCNFDLNFCGWIQSTTDKFEWQRQAARIATTSTGPTKDHSGNGYFAFMDSSSPHQHNDNAVLVSPVQTGPKCLTFWYFMWGDQVSLLNVYAGISMNTLYWIRQGTQGKQWNQANIHFEISSSYQIYFEGLVGTGPKGDIAIDDITVINGNCPQSNLSVPGASCDFENDFCEYVQDKTDTFDWTRQVGSTSSTGTGPPNDHSYGTQFGHYIYIEATNETQGAAAILTVSNVSIGSSDMCLEFWYHMYGIGQGNLMVTTSVQGMTQSQWIKMGNQGPLWNRGSFDISANQGLIDIIFEADRGSGDDSDTALDDIVLKTGKCMEEYGLCNFNLDLCSWTNLQSGDEIDWVQNSGVTQSSYTGPINDHTFGNATGKYLYIESSSPSVKGYRAVLASELFGSSDMVCFRFWYNMYGKTIGTLRISLSSYNTSVDALPELDHQILWELSGNQGQGWFGAAVPIWIQINSYKIFIEGIVGDSYTGDIAIDDLSLGSWDEVTATDDNCPFTPMKAIPSFTTPSGQTTTVSGPVPEGFICNFDNNLCGWIQDQTDTTEWVRMNGDISTNTRPTNDHTSGRGYYMYLENPNGDVNESARFISPDIIDNSSLCFSFWYFMYGKSVNNLDVQLEENNVVTVVWQNGPQDDAWKQASIDIDGADISISHSANIIIEAVQGVSNTSGIAIDDINLVKGQCNITTPTASSRNSSTIYTLAPISRNTIFSTSTTNKVTAKTTAKITAKTTAEITAKTEVKTTVGTTPGMTAGSTTFSIYTTHINSFSSPGITTTDGKRSALSSTADSWKLPVGLVFGGLGLMLLLVGVMYLKRTNRLGNLRFLRFDRSSAAVEDGSQSNPMYDHELRA
ncbi:unnamed protein product [Lymnaea stagnalis]|uniref:MAM domain-containing protein n=1 Tax=Lymnaea stagnalis TaxID=6523 RepID=A0AAV2I3M8_LYMST